MAEIRKSPSLSGLGELEKIFQEYKNKLEYAEKEANEIIEAAWQKAETIIINKQKEAQQIADEIKQKAGQEAERITREAQNRAAEIEKDAADRARKDAKDKTKREAESIIAGTRESAEKQSAEIIYRARKEAEEIMQELIGYLKGVPRGEIKDAQQLEKLLANCWSEFIGGDAERMFPRKLLGRMEEIIWEYPVLEFTIERHGATVMGSTRAELQRWSLDIENKSASVRNQSYRQVIKRERAFEVISIADKLASLIIKREKKR